MHTQDTASSTEALSHLQGTALYSSTSGEGMRLEYPFKLVTAVNCFHLLVFIVMSEQISWHVPLT